MYKEIAIMPTMKIGSKHQVVIPKEIFSELGLRIGDLVEAVREGSNIVFRPQTVIPKDQAWFWTEEHQAKEREADEDIKAGRVSEAFDNAKDLMAYLRKQK